MNKYFLCCFLLFPGLIWARPNSYTELLDYVIPSPDQGETNTCLFMASTGAMELIANKKYGLKNQGPMSRFDLAESYLIWAPKSREHSFFEGPVLRFNKAPGVHHKDWPFSAWNGRRINRSVWHRHPDLDNLPRVELPEVETIPLFRYGNKWTTYVLNDAHIEQIKDALWEHKSPILVNYNDEGYWHVILIVGYDDDLEGACYDTDPSECEGDMGSFYIRDSFGVPIEARDYDWFRVKGNAAYVVKELI